MGVTMENKPKILAFHLPQYHTFPENDEWWGKGFTDWVNVKNAEPLYQGHNQPRVPLYNRYYDMLDYNTRKWQAEIARKYGVYGFCYYHYWFNGKLLMEKPLELLLQEKEIELPFCFCWANEPWTRAWDGQEKEVIMPQVYGIRSDWKKHIDYLMPFFKDDRYIKVNNKPMLVIYRTNNVDDCDDMIRYWKKECIDNGFDGIHIVEEVNGFQNNPVCIESEAYLDFEPQCTTNYEYHGKSIINKYNIKKANKIKTKFGISNNIFFFDNYWKNIIFRPYKKEMNKEHYLGGFVGWDNTPRRKANGDICWGNQIPQKFNKYMKKLFSKSTKNKSEFIFINAWNEWAEGAYLEPDKMNGFELLEAIKELK